MAGGVEMTGTSQAAAVVSGKLTKHVAANRFPANSDSEGKHKLIEAFTEYSGITKNLEKKLDIYKSNNKNIKKYLEFTLPTIDSLLKQRIEYKYEF